MKRFLQWHSYQIRQDAQTSAGFTLTEVIVVIVMALVLAAIAAPSWVALLNRQRLGTATNDVLQALRQTQDEAIRTRYPKQVTFNAGANPPTITVLNEVRRVGQGSVSMEVNPGGAPTTTITFGSTGGPITSPQDITPPTDLPISIEVTVPAGGGIRRCVVIETLLGGMRTANPGEAGCT